MRNQGTDSLFRLAVEIFKVTWLFTGLSKKAVFIKDAAFIIIEEDGQADYLKHLLHMATFRSF